MRLWMLVAVTLSMTACGGAAKRSHDLQYDVRAYNEGVRWAKLPQAATRILPSQRNDFLNEREELEEELRIDDFEIMRLKMEGESQDKAKVQIKWTWHMDREGLVKSTTSRQDWVRYGSRWIMMKEAHLRGDEMPGIHHKVEDEEDEEGKEEGEGDSTESEPSEEPGIEASMNTMSPSGHEYRHLSEVLRVAEESGRAAE